MRIFLWTWVWLLLAAPFSFCLAEETADAPTVFDPRKQSVRPVDIERADSWHFYIAPYYWMSAVTGHTNIAGTRVDFSTPFSQTRHDLDFGGGVDMEASSGPWALIFNPAFVKITQDAYTSLQNVEASSGMALIDTGVYYKLLAKMAPKNAYTIASIEVLGGARIASFHSTINYFDTTSTASDTSGFVVPIIGARVKYNVTPRTHTWVSGDFGGMQINHVSSTWSTMAGLSFSLSKHFDIGVAYKALAIKYSKQVITINNLTHGPTLGCAFVW